MAISSAGTVLRLEDKIPLTESVPCTIGHINFDMKVLGERSAGNPHAAFDVAGFGNGRPSYRARSRPYLNGGVGQATGRLYQLKTDKRCWWWSTFKDQQG